MWPRERGSETERRGENIEQRTPSSEFTNQYGDKGGRLGEREREPERRAAVKSGKSEGGVLVCPPHFFWHCFAPATPVLWTWLTLCVSLPG